MVCNHVMKKYTSDGIMWRMHECNLEVRLLWYEDPGPPARAVTWYLKVTRKLESQKYGYMRSYLQTEECKTPERTLCRTGS